MKRKRQQICHINMLKSWKTPENMTYMSIWSERELDGGKCDESQFPIEKEPEEPKVSPMLTELQKCLLKDLMQEFKVC